MLGKSYLEAHKLSGSCHAKQQDGETRTYAVRIHLAPHGYDNRQQNGATDGTGDEGIGVITHIHNI